MDEIINTVYSFYQWYSTPIGIHRKYSRKIIINKREGFLFLFTEKSLMVKNH